MTQPETKASELVDRLNELRKSGERNEVVLAGIKRDAKALARSDAYHANIILGMVACMERDVDKTIEYHSNALDISDDAYANSQFSTSLNNLYQHDMSLRYAEKAYRYAPDDLRVLWLYITTAYYAFRFRKACELLNDWKRRAPDEPYPDAVIIENAARFVAGRGLSDDETAEIGKAFSQVMIEPRVEVTTTKTTVLSDESSSWLDRLYHIHGTVDDAVDLNFALADHVAETASPNAMQAIVARFTSSPAHASQSH